MSIAFRKRIIAIIFLTAISIISVFGQEVGPSGLYYDSLFNDYIELETSVLELIESEKIDIQQLVKIDDLLLRASEENRTDINSRLLMLRFVVEIEIDAAEKTLNAESFITEMAETERIRHTGVESAKFNKTTAWISLGTAAAAGTVFAVSSLVSQDYYDKYLQTEIADQAAFYLFWWQFLDNISTGSATLAIISSVTAGILAAFY